MNVARLNFSHGSHADHEQVYHLVREAAETTGRAVAVLADLQGPKIRLGRFADGPHEWRTGDSVVITGDDVARHQGAGLLHLPEAAAGGARPATGCSSTTAGSSSRSPSVTGDDIRCLVIEGGPVSNNKGVSLPNVAVSVPALSDKDAEDLRFALELGVDWVALSFVRSAEDIKLVHEIMAEDGRAPAGAGEGGEAGGGRAPGSDRRRLRRRDGRPRRPRRRAAAGPGAAGAEAGRAALPGERQAGHRRHPDARLDDRERPPDPGRGLRRGQRRPRRRRRGDALRRDQRRALPGAHRQHDGEDHHHHRGRVARRAAPAARPAYPRRCADPRPPPPSPAPSTPRRWSPSPRPATPYGGCPGCTATCRCWRSRRWPRSATSSPSPGACRRS